MNRLNSQPKTNNQGRMTANEYMIHKNIPLPNKAKYPHGDLDAIIHKSETINQNSNSRNIQEELNIQKVIEEKNREIEFLKQAEAQSKMLTTQFQEMNQNHQLEVKQLLDQIQNYKQRNIDMKSQVEQYMIELNKINQKYQECFKERDEYLKSLKEFSQDYDIVKLQLQGRDTEIIQLKERIQNMESNYQQELTQFTQSNEYWKRSLMDTQIREITQQFNQDRMQYDMKIKNLEVKNVDLENKCVQLAQEMERMRFKDLEQNKIITKNLQNENDELKTQMFEMMQFISRYEEQIKQIEQNQYQEQEQNDRMRIIVLSSEIDRLHYVIEEQEQKSQEFLQQIQNLEQYEMQCKMLQEQQLLYTQLKEQLSQEIVKNQYLQQNHQEFEEKCAMLTTELERLNLLLKDNYYENEKLQNQIQDYTSIIEQKSNIILQLEIQISNYSQESILLNNDNDNLNMRITQLEEEIQDIKDQTSQELQQYTNELNNNVYNYNQLNHDKQELQKQLEIINREYETLLNLCQQKDITIQDLQNQIQQIEDKHYIELCELKQQNEYQNNSILDSQIQELTLKFNNDIKQLQQQKQQIDLQNSLLQQKLQEQQYTIEDQLQIQQQRLQMSEKERDNLLQEIKDNQMELQILSIDKQQMREEIVKERMKIVIYATEIDRLWSVIDVQSNQIKQQQQSSNDQILQLKQTIQQCENTIYLIEQEKDNYKNENNSLQNKMMLVENELDRIKNQLYEAQKYKDQDIKQKQLLEEIEELYQQIEQYQQEITIMQKNGLEVSDLETKFQAEKMQWETQKYQLTSQIQDQEQRIYLLSQEIKRLSIIGDERQNEIEELRIKFRDVQLTENYEQLKTEYDILEQQIMEFEQNNLKLKSHTQTLEKQIQLLELSLQDKSREVEDIYILINKQRKQNESTNKEAENNRKTQQLLQQNISNLEQQNQYLRDQLQIVTNENQNQQSQIQYIQNNLYERDQMIQKMSNELTEKIKEIDSLKIKYEQKMNNPILQSTIIRNSSLTKQTIKTDQENFNKESILKSKNSFNQVIIGRPQRQVMQQIITDINNQQE